MGGAVYRMNCAPLCFRPTSQAQLFHNLTNRRQCCVKDRKDSACAHVRTQTRMRVGGGDVWEDDVHGGDDGTDLLSSPALTHFPI